VELDLLRQRVKVRMENAPETIGTYSNADIAVLRNGKAKKTDPPIPADLAPISGNRKRERRFEPVEKTVSLESIRFRYSTDTVADAVEESPAEEIPELPAEEKTEHTGRNRRRNRKNKAEKAPEQEIVKKEAPKKEPIKKETPAEDAEAHKKANHRRRFHHRRNRSGNSKAE
jgi:hypothetical protein